MRRLHFVFYASNYSCDYHTTLSFESAIKPGDAIDIVYKGNGATEEFPFELSSGDGEKIFDLPDFDEVVYKLKTEFSVEIENRNGREVRNFLNYIQFTHK